MSAERTPSYHRVVLPILRSGAAVEAAARLLRAYPNFDASAGAKDNYGETYLISAARQGHCQAIRGLIACGASLLVPPKENTPLLRACAAGQTGAAAVRCILEYADGRATVNVANSSGASVYESIRVRSASQLRLYGPFATAGCTPLHLAACHGDIALIRALIVDYGADPTSKQGNILLNSPLSFLPLARTLTRIAA